MPTFSRRNIMDENYQKSYENYEPDYYSVYQRQQERKARGAFSRFGFALFGYLAIAYVAIFAFEIVMLLSLGIEGTSQLMAKYPIIEWLESFLPMYILSLPIFYLIIKNMKKSTAQKSGMTVGEFFALFLICQALMTVGNMIGNMLNSFFSILKNDEVINQTGELVEAMPTWLTLLIVVVVGPIVEELMFRKFMIDRLSVWGNGIAITASSIAFGLFHGNLYQFFYATFIGFILGYMYAKTRNIKHCALMHMLLNFFGTIAIMPVIEHMDRMYEMSELLHDGIEVNFSEYLSSIMVVSSYTVIQYAMVIAGAVLLFKHIRNKKFALPDPAEYSISREKKLSVALLNPGAIVFLVLSLFFFVLSVLA